MRGGHKIFDRILFLAAVVLVAVCVSLVYFYFEAAVRNSIDFIWDELLDTEPKRALVVPTCIVLSLAYFGAQHYFDAKSERSESEGLGDAPAPTVANFIKVIGIGFLSLIAGASLGPEAILVPASLIIGGYVGSSLLKKKSSAPLLTMVGFISILAAFFNSFWAGMAGLLLVKKQLKLNLDLGMVLMAAVASVTCVLTLSLFSSESFARLPASHWEFKLEHILVVAALLLGGFAVTHLLALAHKLLEKIKELSWAQGWWMHGIIAGAGLSALYLIGGPLVEFTGNESIAPMLHQAASLGIIGLLWLLIVKIAAISWSKALGYRGGMVFPTIFVAATLVAIGQQVDAAISFNIGFIAVMIGILVADAKLKILF